MNFAQRHQEGELKQFLAMANVHNSPVMAKPLILSNTIIFILRIPNRGKVTLSYHPKKHIVTILHKDTSNRRYKAKHRTATFDIPYKIPLKEVTESNLWDACTEFPFVKIYGNKYKQNFEHGVNKACIRLYWELIQFISLQIKEPISSPLIHFSPTLQNAIV